MSDSATLTGSYHATGSIAFTLYSNPVCSTQVYTSSGGLSGASAISGLYSTVAAGTYYWKASYAGDPDNTAFTTACGSSGETVAVAKASPTLSTSAIPTVTLGGSIMDTATLAGLEHPDGSGYVAFGLFTNAHCVGLPVYLSASPESNGTVDSGSYKPTAAGSYYWAAVYTGDSNNNGFTTSCGGAGDEKVVVTGATTAAHDQRQRIRASLPALTERPDDGDPGQVHQPQQRPGHRHRSDDHRFGLPRAAAHQTF